MKDNRRKKIYMALGGVAIVAMMGISFASIRGCTRSDVATPTEATATDAVSEVTTVVNKTTEVVTTEKSKSNNKKGGSISGGVKKDHSTKESTSEEKSTDNNTKTPDTTEYTGNTEEPTTQRQADNDDGSSKKPPKKDDDDGKKNPQPTTQSPTTEEATTREPVTEKPTTEEPVTTEHQHNWVAVKHEAKVKPAWREEVHTTELHLICKNCGYDFTVNGEDGDIETILDHTVNTCGGSNYGTKRVDVVSYVDHPEEVIKEAYISYKCSTCGATK